MAINGTREVLLMIADISGYTEFMVSSGLEIEHSQKIITELIQAIIEQVHIPLEVSKLEGDAVFLYAVKEGDDYNWADVTGTVGEKLLLFFEAFHRKLSTLGGGATCTCGACSNLAALKLKIVVHSGAALFYQINQFNELSGGDVILVHRLLKNSITHDEYILMTESAYSDIEFPGEILLERGTEEYEHLGSYNTLVYYPHKQVAA